MGVTNSLCSSNCKPPCSLGGTEADAGSGHHELRLDVDCTKADNEFGADDDDDDDVLFRGCPRECVPETLNSTDDGSYFRNDLDNPTPFKFGGAATFAMPGRVTNSHILTNDAPRTASIGTDATDVTIECGDPNGAGLSLMSQIAYVEQLVDQLRMYEAGLALRELEKNMADTFTSCINESADSKTINQRLRREPLFASLRSFLTRYERALEEIAIPAQRTDVTWDDEFEVKDPAIGSDFSLCFKIRYKTKEEYDTKGPWAQLAAKVEIRNFPLRLSRRVALEREVDLFGTTLPSSVSVELAGGEAGNRDNLFSALSHSITQAEFSPWKTDSAELREFSKLKDPPLSGLRPGMFLMMTSSPPEESKELAGFQIPPCSSGCKRLSGLTILRFLEPEAALEKCRMTIMAEGGINVPPWLLPTTLVKKVFSSGLTASLKHVTEVFGSNWPDTPFESRMIASPSFYEPIIACDRSDAPGSGDEDVLAEKNAKAHADLDVT